MERCFGICLPYGRKYSFKVQMTKAELSEIIEEIQNLSEEQVLSKEQKEELQRQCKAACASVERTYHGKQTEGGVVDEMEARMEWAAD